MTNTHNQTLTPEVVLTLPLLLTLVSLIRPSILFRIFGNHFFWMKSKFSLFSTGGGFREHYNSLKQPSPQMRRLVAYQRSRSCWSDMKICWKINRFVPFLLLRHSQNSSPIIAIELSQGNPWLPSSRKTSTWNKSLSSLNPTATRIFCWICSSCGLIFPPLSSLLFSSVSLKHLFLQKKASPGSSLQTVYSTQQIEQILEECRDILSLAGYQVLSFSISPAHFIL